MGNTVASGHAAKNNANACDSAIGGHPRSLNTQLFFSPVVAAETAKSYLHKPNVVNDAKQHNKFREKGDPHPNVHMG